MRLNELRPVNGSKKKRKRIGRGPGSGHGKTACRGHKGQNSRSGGKVPPWFEGGQMPLQRRIPKRGFNNLFKKRYEIINIDTLERCFDDGAKITLDGLKAKNIIKAKYPVKILGNGELKKKFIITASKFSIKAIEKIEAAGGKTEVI